MRIYMHMTCVWTNGQQAATLILFAVLSRTWNMLHGLEGTFPRLLLLTFWLMLLPPMPAMLLPLLLLPNERQLKWH